MLSESGVTTVSTKAVNSGSNEGQSPRLEKLSPWPLPRLPRWAARVNEPLTKQEQDAVRLSALRGQPFGDDGWAESIARRLNLESTMRPRVRPRVRFPKEDSNKEA